MLDVEIAFVTPVDDDANEIVVNHFDVSHFSHPLKTACC